ncbi:hypothetical protein SHO565_16740 [Streptomyces sp. HO565]
MQLPAQVLFTAEGAPLWGNQPTVGADACATRPLQTMHAGGTSLTARQIHDGVLATITDRFGIVVPSLAGLK